MSSTGWDDCWLRVFRRADIIAVDWCVISCTTSWKQDGDRFVALSWMRLFWKCSVTVRECIAFFRRPIDGTFIVTALIALLAGQLLADYVRRGLPRVQALPLAAVSSAA